MCDTIGSTDGEYMVGQCRSVNNHRLILEDGRTGQWSESVVKTRDSHY